MVFSNKRSYRLEKQRRKKLDPINFLVYKSLMTAKLATNMYLKTSIILILTGIHLKPERFLDVYQYDSN